MSSRDQKGALTGVQILKRLCLNAKDINFSTWASVAFIEHWLYIMWKATLPQHVWHPFEAPFCSGVIALCRGTKKTIHRLIELF